MAKEVVDGKLLLPTVALPIIPPFPYSIIPLPIFGSLLKTTDLTACTQFFAEELVWFLYSRRDYYNIRFWLFSAENLKPRAWVSYRQQKPEIDAYLERFCKAKLAEYQKSPEKPRVWPYYGTKT